MSSSTALFSDSVSAKEPRLADSPRTFIKIAYIGGGSREWAIKLMADLALSDKLCGSLHLFDTDSSAAHHNRALASAIFSHPSSKTHFDVHAAPDLRSALTGADFVIISIEPGPISMRRADLEIPAKYGVLQTVGDTTGPGGILRAMRSAPIFEEFGEILRETCPEAWVINYTNPMAVCTSSLFRKAPELKAFGCCHEVFGTQEMLARHVGDWFEVEVPHRAKIELDIAGVNHFTWAGAARWNGQDLFPRLLEMVTEKNFFTPRNREAEDRKANQRWFESNHLVALDMFRRFGALGAAGDRHLVEFIPWYLETESTLHRWGVVVTPYAWREERANSTRKTASSITSSGLLPSGEEGVQQIEALLGLRTLTTNINLPNKGQIPFLDSGIVVETFAEFRKNSIRPLLAGSLPEGASTLVKRASQDQQLLVRAIEERRIDLAFEALLCSPLVKLPTDQAREMFDEMVAATRPMLSGWR